jgi:DNA primase
MQFFPPAFLEELRSRLSLAQVIGRSVRLVKRGREYVGLCPFHNEKSPSFTVIEEKGFYHCFGCGTHGDAIGFVMHTAGLSFPEAVERLAGEAGLPIPRVDAADRAKAERIATVGAALEAAATWFAQQLEKPSGAEAKNYLTGRGLTAETIARFRLGFAPASRNALKDAMAARNIPAALLVEAGLLITPEDGGAPYDRFRQRVMFPIGDGRGRVIAFGARALAQGQQPKYINSPETPLFHKGVTLYNLAMAREAARQAETVVVAEGYMDVIALVQAGFAHAVAPMGTALTEEQMALLWRFASEPILCFDGDEAGRRAAARAAMRALPSLAAGKSLRFALLPKGEDPDDLIRRRGPAAMAEILAAAAPLADFLWRMASEGRQMDTPERRAGLNRALDEYCAAIADQTVRGYYREHFARRLAQASPAANAGSRGAGARGSARGGPWMKKGGWAGSGALFQGGAAEIGRGGPVPAPLAKRENLALTVVLRHPELLDRHAEALSEVELAGAELDTLRRAILDEHARRAGLDAASLAHHLTLCGLADTVDRLIGPAAKPLERFARADAPLAEAEEGFLHVLDRLRLRQVERELLAAENALAADFTDENLQRLRALKSQIASGGPGAALGDGTH